MLQSREFFNSSLRPLIFVQNIHFIVKTTQYLCKLFLPRGLLWRLVNMALRKLRLLPSLHALPWMRSWKEKCLEIYWIISRQVSSCDWWQSWRQLTLCLPMTLLIDWTNENFDGLWSNKARVHLSNSNRVVSILFFSLSSFLLLFNYSFIHFHSWKQQLIN